MHKKSLILLLLVVFAASLAVMPLSFADADFSCATDDEAFSYYDTHSQLKGVHPSADSDASAYGQKFNCSIDAWLSTATFWIYCTGDPEATYTLTGVLWESDTEDNSTATTGTILDESENVVTEVEVNGTYLPYEFDFGRKYHMEANKTYVIGVKVTSGTIDDTHYVSLASDTHDSNWGYRNKYSSSAWAAAASPDLCFEIYGNTYSAFWEGYEEEEEDGWGDASTGELIDNVANFLVPLVILLLPAILFIIFFKRTDKWLILIGLAIGAGLGFYFGMIPAWLVFLVAIGLIGLAYSEVRRNG